MKVCLSTLPPVLPPLYRLEERYTDVDDDVDGIQACNFIAVHNAVNIFSTCVPVYKCTAHTHITFDYKKTTIQKSCAHTNGLNLFFDINIMSKVNAIEDSDNREKSSSM